MIRLRTRLVLLLSLVLVGCQGSGHVQTRRAQGPVCAVYFSLHGGCTQEVAEALRQAQQSVLVQAYSFTSTPIAQALVEAYRRGVKVEVILDRSQQTDRRSSAQLLAQAGVPLDIDAAHAIAHNKVMVIDGQTILSGSFNFTEAAEDRNAENLLVIRDAALAAQYAKNWQAHRAHSKPYRPP